MKTRIELDDMDLLILAEDFARRIHGVVVQMHLRCSWGIWESAAEPNLYVLQEYQRDGIGRIRAALRSIKNPDARRPEKEKGIY
jgi:GNAT superfamily N-acetyltransferase